MLSIPHLLGVNFCIQLLGWVPSSILKTEKIFDVTGTSAHIIVMSLALHQLDGRHTRQTVLGMMVIVWASRLLSYLFIRCMYNEDKRFKLIVVNPLRFLKAFTIQGIWVCLNLTPVLLCVTSPNQTASSTRDYIGWLVWTVGFSLETVADYQKFTFRQVKANKTKFISSGLWSISRHPNYFGEVLLWSGVFISASTIFSIPQYLAIICPMLLSANIILRSGIPYLESYGQKNWGKTKEYQKYIKDTPLFIPFFK